MGSGGQWGRNMLQVAVVVKNRVTPKWHPIGKWKQKPVVPWRFHFDPYPSALFKGKRPRGQKAPGTARVFCGSACQGCFGLILTPHGRGLSCGITIRRCCGLGQHRDPLSLDKPVFEHCLNPCPPSQEQAPPQSGPFQRRFYLLPRPQSFDESPIDWGRGQKERSQRLSSEKSKDGWDLESLPSSPCWLVSFRSWL